MLWLVLAACLVNSELYQARRAELTDDDGDGWSEFDGDCDDDNAAVHPGADELCNGFDDDCDDRVDSDAVDQATWYLDRDGDGYGDPGSSATGCDPPPDSVSTGTDCDDTNDAVHPGAVEVCNHLDDDCDKEVDTDAVDQESWYVDSDGDGYGDPESLSSGCQVPDDGVSKGMDCDDGDEAVNPGQDEVCDNGRDDDCDGEAPECGLAGEGLASMDAAWSVGVGTILSDGGSSQLQSLAMVDDIDLGWSLLAGLPSSSAGGDGAVLQVPLRSEASSLESVAEWLEVAPLEGLIEVGESVLALPEGPTRGLPGLALTGHDDEGSQIQVYDGLPSSLESYELQVGGWADAGGLRLTGVGDLDGDTEVDLVAWSETHRGIIGLLGPLEELDSGDEPVVIAQSDAWVAGSEVLSFGGWYCMDWNGEGSGRVFGAGHLWTSEGVVQESLLYAIPWGEGGAMADAPFLRTVPTSGYMPGFSSGSPSFAADIDGDGYLDLVFPSYSDSREAGYAGSVGIVLGPHEDGTRPLAPDIELLGTESLQAVGSSAIAGDFDADATPAIAVGWLDDTAAASGGAVGLWRPEAGTATVDELEDVIRGDIAQQQAMVARAADVDSDGYEDLVIIAPGTETVDGAIYLFEGGGI